MFGIKFQPFITIDRRRMRPEHQHPWQLQELVRRSSWNISLVHEAQIRAGSDNSTYDNAYCKRIPAIAAPKCFSLAVENCYV